jgi:hypothetical protein
MRKIQFYNELSTDENIDTKRSPETHLVREKQVVDINKLLNRIKIDKQYEIKKKIIFYSLFILGLSLLGSLIVFF